MTVFVAFMEALCQSVSMRAWRVGSAGLGGFSSGPGKFFFYFSLVVNLLLNVTFSGPLLENFGLESALPKTQADISAITPSLLAKKKCSIQEFLRNLFIQYEVIYIWEL